MADEEFVRARQFSRTFAAGRSPMRLVLGRALIAVHCGMQPDAGCAISLWPLRPNLTRHGDHTHRLERRLKLEPTGCLKGQKRTLAPHSAVSRKRPPQQTVPLG